MELSGEDLSILCQGLGELPLKIAEPVKNRLVAAIIKAKEAKPRLVGGRESEDSGVDGTA